MAHDQTLTCTDCGNSFTWTIGEQQFYASKGLQNAPKRCGPCRQRKRAQREARPA